MDDKKKTNKWKIILAIVLVLVFASSFEWIAAFLVVFGVTGLATYGLLTLKHKIDARNAEKEAALAKAKAEAQAAKDAEERAKDDNPIRLLDGIDNPSIAAITENYGLLEQAALSKTNSVGTIRAEYGEKFKVLRELMVSRNEYALHAAVHDDATERIQKIDAAVAQFNDNLIQRTKEINSQSDNSIDASIDYLTGTSDKTGDSVDELVPEVKTFKARS